MNIWVILGYAIGALAVLSAIYLTVFHILRPSNTASDVPSLRGIVKDTSAPSPSRMGTEVSASTQTHTDDEPNIFESGEGIASRRAVKTALPKTRRERRNYSPVESHRVAARPEFAPKKFSLEEAQKKETDKPVFSWDD